MIKAVDVVKINELIPIYRDGVEAQAIQVARIAEMGSDESVQFNVIVGKSLYEVGDKVLYIMPDYTIPDTDVFQEYHKPSGDPKKSKLGKKGRIKAIKFNFSFEGSFDPIYSNGIIMPISTFESDLEFCHLMNEDDSDFMEYLGVQKYVADLPGGVSSGLTKGDLPAFLYATDETRIELLKGHIDDFCRGHVLNYTVKRDGSSTTIYARKERGEWVGGICARKQEKKLDQRVITAFKDDKGIEYTKYKRQEDGCMGFINAATEEFFTQRELDAKGYERVYKIVKDNWVDTIKEKGYLDRLLEFCKSNDIELALRGELIGQGGSKGSGCKKNPDAQNPRDVVWFGLDDLSSGHATRIHYGLPYNLESVCKAIDAPYTEIIESELNPGYDKIIENCQKIFHEYKTTKGMLIEGVVIRTKDNNMLSCKFINPEYDARS